VCVRLVVFVSALSDILSDGPAREGR